MRCGGFTAIFRATFLPHHVAEFPNDVYGNVRLIHPGSGIDRPAEMFSTRWNSNSVWYTTVKNYRNIFIYLIFIAGGFSFYPRRNAPPASCGESPCASFNDLSSDRGGGRDAPNAPRRTVANQYKCTCTHTITKKPKEKKSKTIKITPPEGKTGDRALSRSFANSKSYPTCIIIYVILLSTCFIYLFNGNNFLITNYKF